MTEKTFSKYWMCEPCARKAGGVFPEGHTCTVTMGRCGHCGKEATLIPWVDFDWKDDRKKDFRAKLCRD